MSNLLQRVPIQPEKSLGALPDPSGEQDMDLSRPGMQETLGPLLPNGEQSAVSHAPPKSLPRRPRHA
ncbi:MAG TPA: hypothetical protein VK638_45400, partial [Edaphobacter sp.]|nr:hypothetical protein [Edaphobacter sp.]